MHGYCSIAAGEWAAWSPTQDHPRMWRSVKVTNVGFGGALLRIEA